MEKAIIIPDKIIAGYRESYNNNMKKAYISFINEKNKVNKESNFERYIDSKESLNNEPISGFTLNKHEETYINEYTEGRTYVSLFDPRGFIVKISVGNYINICLSTDINKGEIKGKFIYAFINGYPILLNVESKEYKDSLNRQQEMIPVNADTIVVGQRYCLKRDAKKNKNPDQYIYLGKHNYHEILNYVNHVLAHGRNYITDNNKGKKHIFMLDGKDRHGNAVFKSFMPNSLLTVDNSDYIDENIDDYINQYLNTREYSGLKIKYLDEDIETKIENNKVQNIDFVGFVGNKVYFIFTKSKYDEKNTVKLSISVFDKKDFNDNFLISSVLNNYIKKNSYNEYEELYKRYIDKNEKFESFVNDEFFIKLMELQHNSTLFNKEEFKSYFYEKTYYNIDKNKSLKNIYQLLKEYNFKPFVYD